ncbi:uncharacterized protein LOC117639732 [Thrips palmi]|uniref:Uncharacterized protein LOC117639732 n=1 Tax=Thrips palmi TaxID=161013 RepID=A0A6P8ZHA2_THRPL|nr:uncharacterized protein LOC117639732 [Thrips palmi]
MPDSQSVRDILDVMPDPWAWHLVDPAGRLPGELMVEIFGHLDQESLINAGQVSRRWRALAKRQCLWNAVDLHDTMSALHWQEFCVKYEAPSEFADIINLEVRRFLRKLVSAPYLRSLVLDSSSGIIDAPLTAILWAPISRYLCK